MRFVGRQHRKRNNNPKIFCLCIYVGWINTTFLVHTIYSQCYYLYKQVGILENNVISYNQWTMVLALSEAGWIAPELMLKEFSVTMRFCFQDETGNWKMKILRSACSTKTQSVEVTEWESGWNNNLSCLQNWWKFSIWFTEKWSLLKMWVSREFEKASTSETYEGNLWRGAYCLINSRCWSTTEDWQRFLQFKHSRMYCWHNISLV